jgi:hypothetical protein
VSPVRLAAPGFAPTPRTIADQFRQRLLALDYSAFAQCVCLLLEALGYEQARPAGRQAWKGYNRPGGGGYDLEAVLPGGLSPRRVVVQLKPFRGSRVHQSNVDELRGACLRSGAEEALLVTTSAFSHVVQNCEMTYKEKGHKQTASPNRTGARIAPVRLIDGTELIDLLIRFRLGVRECSQGRGRRLEIDEAFFREITTLRFPTIRNGMMEKTMTFGTMAAPGAATRTPQENYALLSESYVPPKWRVIIHISSGLRPGTQRGGQAEVGLSEEELPKGND